MSSNAATLALSNTRNAVYWLDRPDTPQPADALSGQTEADLVIVGAGFTGLWTALIAAEADPGRRIIVLEAETAAFGASGRNGGFCEASLTHGLANGLAHWPDELHTLLRFGDENLDDLMDTINRHAIDCNAERTGTMDIAVEPWQVDELQGLAEASSRLGVDHALLDTEAIRAEIDSPTYLAGLWQRTGAAMVDPARLAWGLQSAAKSLGVIFHDHSPVRSIEKSGTGLELHSDDGRVRTGRAVVATNAYRKPLPKIRRHVIPVYDHVLMTEPLSTDQWAEIGWHGRQGLADAGNQFHYYRRTADGRILWGGYDVLYHFGGRVGPSVEHHAPTTRRLAENFFHTFPQAEGLRFTHRWSGPIASTTRFTCAWGTTHAGRVSWAAGYTGLGVGASRFGARVALDLVDGLSTERTELQMVRRRPVPIPPEPARWLAVQATRAAIKRADRREGREGLWLRTLGRFGIGLNS
ncbi:MAG: FAD-dependent oxidoreductase [Actinobacteria bacterium]|jgi:glycine/D-amino acid oxidase-like deaminating enzyme|nr:FAD-dependent oxidoreductase [Actinomycetota bacterium]MBT3687151.1 FAD-dependent oxidoreductase [Actinomycetota bacterium]MBT4038019.1 FAD-dependent oxidoreductase [Actinomycetota bacterium]MBT4279503.1 FAD-dependent oxidoreductase [Actinomycetota bacterium]MBT4343170.1 FAD-dependent oxidoreductase [Actinomycetota bacterium]